MTRWLVRRGLTSERSHFRTRRLQHFEYERGFTLDVTSHTIYLVSEGLSYWSRGLSLSPLDLACLCICPQRELHCGLSL